MKTILSKIIAIALSTVLAVASTVAVGAFETTVEPVSVDSTGFTDLRSTYWMFNNKIYFSRFNTPASSVFHFGLQDENGPFYDYEVNFKDLNSTDSKTISLLSDQMYEIWLGSSTHGIGNSHPIVEHRSYNKTGGYYRKVRIKLSSLMNGEGEFYNYFASDGSTTKTNPNYGTHTFRFGEAEKSTSGGVYYEFHGGMCVISGAAVTAVTPDSNGEIEFFVNTKIGEESRLFTSTNIYYLYPDGFETRETERGAEGVIPGLTFGDADSDCSVNIKDATRIQSAIAEISTLDNLQKFVSDVNLDKKIDVNDVTCMQKYIADMDY